MAGSLCATSTVQGTVTPLRVLIRLPTVGWLVGGTASRGRTDREAVNITFLTRSKPVASLSGEKFSGCLSSEASEPLSERWHWTSTLRDGVVVDYYMPLASWWRMHDR